MIACDLIRNVEIFKLDIFINLYIYIYIHILS